eukprot:gene59123-80955_t
MFLPEEDRHSRSKQSLNSLICMMFGGRVAEELTLGPDGVTTGASNDIERATNLARNMVTKWGLSDKLGPLAYSEDEGEVFLGRSVTQHKNMSDDTANAIDREIREVIDTNYARAKQILVDNFDKLHAMADALMKYETIDSDQIARIMQGKDPGAPGSWTDGPRVEACFTDLVEGLPFKTRSGPKEAMLEFANLQASNIQRKPLVKLRAPTKPQFKKQLDLVAAYADLRADRAAEIVDQRTLPMAFWSSV